MIIFFKNMVKVMNWVMCLTEMQSEKRLFLFE